jgi:uncharacterized membrane protein YbjE (DUF340 family)
MITDALLGFVAWLVETVLGWLPVITPPSWLGTARDGISQMFAGASTMGAWLPVALGFQVLAAVLACVVAGLLIKLVRSVASYFLAGGGSSG